LLAQISGTTIQNLNLSARLAHAVCAHLCHSIVARADVNHNYFRNTVKRKYELLNLAKNLTAFSAPYYGIALFFVLVTKYGYVYKQQISILICAPPRTCERVPHSLLDLSSAHSG